MSEFIGGGVYLANYYNECKLSLVPSVVLSVIILEKAVCNFSESFHRPVQITIPRVLIVTR